MTTANGAEALFGLLVDGPSDRYAVGQPGLNISGLAAPTAPPGAAAGAAGNLTGDFVYRYSFGQADGRLTKPSPPSSDTFAGTGLSDITWGGNFTGDTWVVTLKTEANPDVFTWTKNSGSSSSDVPITGAAQTLSDGVTVTFAAITGHNATDAWTRDEALSVSAKAATVSAVVAGGTGTDRRVVERGTVVSEAITWAVCGTIWDNSTTTFSDDTATLDTSVKLPTADETASNAGFLFLDPDSFDLDASFTQLRSQGLAGSAGQRRGVPGPIKLEGTAKGDFKAADLAPLLMAGAGVATTNAKVAGEPTFRTVISATTAKRTPKTASALVYRGTPDVPPTIITGIGVEELTVNFSGGKIVDKAMKLQGASFTRSGWATKVGGGGTYAGTFLALGLRSDALAGSEDVYVKVTSAPLVGTFGIKCKVGSGSTYDGSELVGYYNTVSGRMTKGGANFGDGIELSDENDVRLGFDVGSNRLPYTLIATGDIQNLAVDDEYLIPFSIPIPGVGSSPYSGYAPVFADGPVFTDAHVTISAGGTVVEAQSGTFKLTWPKPEKRGLGADARVMRDRASGGFHAVSLSLTRFLDDDDWQALLQADTTASVVVTFEGPPIQINPGVFSAYRHSFSTTVPTMEIQSTKRPVANQNDVVETIEFQAVQPADRSVDLYTMTLTSDQGWRVPA